MVVLLARVLSSTCPILAGVHGEPLDERQLTRNAAENHIIGAAISPDGKLIAYANLTGLHMGIIETGETPRRLASRGSARPSLGC